MWAAAEAYLVDAARHEDPAGLRRSGELLLARLDPDGHQPREDEAQRRRSVGIGGRGGANAIYGQLTDVNKAVWQAIFDSLTAPLPAADGTRDQRSAGQRQHDALLEAGLRLLRSGTLPDVGGTPAGVVVRVHAEDLATAARGEAGGVAQTGHGDVVSVERFLRLADQADITTVVLTTHGEVPEDRQRGRNPSPPTPSTKPRSAADKVGWMGRCAGTKPDRPERRPIHPTSPEPDLA